jgi:hypothetical protein
MTQAEFLSKFGDELNGLLLASFALDLQWKDDSPTSTAARGKAMRDQMIRGRKLLERAFNDISHADK